MKNIIKLSIFTFLFFNFCQFVFAEIEPNDFVNQVFAELDANKDGIINKKDIEKFSQREFVLIDINKDNAISKDEFFEFVCDKSCKTGNCECKDYKNKEDLPYLKEYWYRMDTNKDGSISKEEKLGVDLDSFYSLDDNSDGKITRDEVEKQLY